MGPIKLEMRCAFCNTPLSVWNTHTCMECGKHLCAQHAHQMRMRHSYVLSSICPDCCAHENYAFPKMRAAAKTSAPPPTT